MARRQSPLPSPRQPRAARCGVARRLPGASRGASGGDLDLSAADSRPEVDTWVLIQKIVFELYKYTHTYTHRDRHTTTTATVRHKVVVT